MQARQCPNGHYYDVEKSPTCPYCSGGSEVSVTRPLDGGLNGVAQAQAFSVTVPVDNNGGGSSIPHTIPLDVHKIPGEIPETIPIIQRNDNHTVALNVNEKNIQPIKGWLVCKEGEKPGVDFKLTREMNYIGRSDKNNVCIAFDKTISNEKHAYIQYDFDTNEFWISNAQGATSVRINKLAIHGATQLKAYDEIGIGSTVFIFVPLCTGDFKW